MNFGNIKDRLTDVYGGKLTSDTALYGRCINDAYHKICAYSQWWWLETYTTLTFQAPVVQSIPYSCIEGVTSMQPVTAAGALTTAYSYGWLVAGDYTYRINSVAGTAPWTVTIDSNFIETTSTYSINAWNDTLNLPSDFDHPVAVAPRLDAAVRPLVHVPYEEIETYGPDMSDQYVDVAQYYSVYRETSVSTGFRIRIWPPPDTEVDYVLRYRQHPVDLSSDSDIPLIPAKHHSVLVDAARLELLTVTGGEKEEVNYWGQQMLSGLDRMIRDASKRGKVKHQFDGYGSVTTSDLPFRLINYTEGVDAS